MHSPSNRCPEVTHVYIYVTIITGNSIPGTNSILGFRGEITFTWEEDQACKIKYANTSYERKRGYFLRKPTPDLGRTGSPVRQLPFKISSVGTNQLTVKEIFSSLSLLNA